MTKMTSVKTNKDIPNYVLELLSGGDRHLNLSLDDAILSVFVLFSYLNRLLGAAINASEEGRKKFETELKCIKQALCVSENLIKFMVDSEMENEELEHFKKLSIIDCIEITED